MRKLTFLEAVREALYQEMEANPAVFIIGEDVRIGGGFSVTKGFFDKFGEKRVLDTPISETGFTGLAVGAGMGGMRPVVEYQFGDFVFCAMDQIINQAAKLRYMSGGQVNVPVVFRLPVGANRRGAHHAQCSESIFMNVAGLKIVVPGSPFDAKGLLISALHDGNPVLFFEHKLLYSTGGEKGKVPPGIPTEVPEEPYSIPFGSAAVRHPGKDVTVVATMLMLHRALQAAAELEEEGISLEVIDPRTLVPLDTPTIVDSVKKTRRLVVVEECQATGSWGNEIISTVAEHISTPASVKRISCTPTPIPYAVKLENRVIPGVEEIKKEIRTILSTTLEVTA